jgi:hypothetical protein
MRDDLLRAEIRWLERSVFFAIFPAVGGTRVPNHLCARASERRPRCAGTIFEMARLTRQWWLLGGGDDDAGAAAEPARLRGCGLTFERIARDRPA